MSGIEAAFFGALGRDAEVKTSQAGKPYLRFSLRVGDGDAAQWVSVLAFDPQAVELADKFVKGSHCYVEGRLSTSEYIGHGGEKRLGLSVMSWHCRLSQIGRQKVRRDSEKISVARGETYHSPRSAPAGRLPGSGAPFDDEVGF